jgi:hypothetical protein
MKIATRRWRAKAPSFFLIPLLFFSSFFHHSSFIVHHSIRSHLPLFLPTRLFLWQMRIEGMSEPQIAQMEQIPQIKNKNCLISASSALSAVQIFFPLLFSLEINYLKTWFIK